MDTSIIKNCLSLKTRSTRVGKACSSSPFSQIERGWGPRGLQAIVAGGEPATAHRFLIASLQSERSRCLGPGEGHQAGSSSSSWPTSPLSLWITTFLNSLTSNYCPASAPVHWLHATYISIKIQFTSIIADSCTLAGLRWPSVFRCPK